MKNKFSNIFLSHKGKASDKWSSYLDVYDRVFAYYKARKISLLEIGIQNGGSLEIYASYFENSETIVGCDINALCSELSYANRKIKVVVGDCKSPAVQSKISSISEKFDLIIDDGSHVSDDIVQTFLIYFNSLKPGGSFIIEDLHASYWKDWNGGLFYEKSSMSFLKMLLDVVNHEHWGIDADRTAVLVSRFPDYKNLIEQADLSDIASISFFNSVCVIRKSNDRSQGLGKRVIAGKSASVVPQVFSWNGTSPIKTDERSNVHSDISSVENGEPNPLGVDCLCPCGSGKTFKHCHGALS